MVLGLGWVQFHLIFGDGLKAYFKNNFDSFEFWCSQSILTKFSKKFHDVHMTFFKVPKVVKVFLNMFHVQQKKKNIRSS